MQHTQHPGHDETKGRTNARSAAGAQSPGRLGLCRVCVFLTRDVLKSAESLNRAYEKRRIDRVLAIPAVDGKIKVSDIRKANRLA